MFKELGRGAYQRQKRKERYEWERKNGKIDDLSWGISVNRKRGMRMKKEEEKKKKNRKERNTEQKTFLKKGGK